MGVGGDRFSPAELSGFWKRSRLRAQIGRISARAMFSMLDFCFAQTALFEWNSRGVAQPG
jgi:hypothetical protein